MTTLKSIVTMLCLVSVTVGVLVLIGDAHRNSRHADQLILTTDAAIKENGQILKQTIGEAQNAIETFNQASGSLKEAAESDKGYTAQILKHADDVTTDTRRILVKIDQFTIPAAEDLIRHSDNNIGAISDAFISTAGAYQRDADSFNALIANPQNVELVGRLDLAALHLDEATAHGNDVLAHFDHVAGYYDARLTSPKGFVKTLGKGLLQLVTPASNVAIAIK